MAEKNPLNYKLNFKKIARKTLWIILGLLLLAGSGYYLYRTYVVSDGSRTGIIFKVSRKGVVFKTYEGQLNLAGSDIMTAKSTWDFSIKNSNVYSQLQGLEGKIVRCHYKQLVDPFPWQGKTEYLVYKVEQAQ